MFLLSRRVEWNIIWPLKVILNIWPYWSFLQGHDLVVKGHVAYQSILYGRSEHIYGVLIALAGLYQKLLPKNWWWPFMTWNDLGDMVMGHWLQYSDSGVKSTCNPMFESVSNGFLPKETLFIFLPLTYNGEVAKLTSPWVTDIQIPRYTFIDTGTNTNRWKFGGDRAFGVAMTSIQTFLRWGHLTWPGDLTLRDMGLKFSQLVRKRCLNRHAKNGGAFF